MGILSSILCWIYANFEVSTLIIKSVLFNLVTEKLYMSRSGYNSRSMKDILLLDKNKGNPCKIESFNKFKQSVLTRLDSSW